MYTLTIELREPKEDKIKVLHYYLPTKEGAYKSKDLLLKRMLRDRELIGWSITHHPFNDEEE